MIQEEDPAVPGLSAGSVSRLSAYVVMAVACLALAGWARDAALPKSSRPEWAGMEATAMLCMALLALALLSLRASAPWKRSLGALLATVVCAAALAGAIAHLTMMAAGHDPARIPMPLAGAVFGLHNRMAVLMTAVFVCISGAVLLLWSGRRRLAGVAHVLVLLPAALSYFVLAGHVLNIPALRDWIGTPISFRMTAALFVLCVGVLCARTDTWLMVPLTGRQAGALMARRLLPVLLILPLVIGWLRVHGERTGVFESAIGVALVASSYAVCFLFLVWWNSKVANREQFKSETSLREARDRLEERVRERTAELSHTVETLREETLQRARAEESALAAGLYARSLIEASLDPLVTISPDGKITDVNRATEEATGVERRKLIGSDFSDYFTEPEKAREGYRAVLSKGEVRDYPLTIRHASGRAMGVLYNATLYRDEAGNILGVFAAARDVTERMAAELELERHRHHLEELVKQRTSELERAVTELARSNKDLEQFAYVASHDLQEPLRAVGGFMSILGSQYGDRLDAEGRECVTHAIEGAERMQALVNDLLSYSRVGSRGGALKPVAMKGALDAALANLRAAIEESGATVLCDPLPTVAADASQMVQLLQNLIGNAIKFRSARTPEVRLSARREEGRWLFSVRDNGIGIEPQYFDRVFLIFQRLHARTRYPGTGIGLAICKRIVERHSGKIWIESKFGEGTTFFFTIPDKGDAE